MVNLRDQPTDGDHPAITRPLGFAATAVFGTNPWPSAGVVGHIAMVVASLEALTYLVGLTFAVAQGDLGYGMFGWDFVSYFGAATMLLNGEAHVLYDPSRQLEVQRALLANLGGSPPYLVAYFNPPLWAAVVAVMAPFGLLVGVWLWRLMTLAASLWILAVAAKQEGAASWLRAAALMLCFFPFIEAWQHGQMAAAMLIAFGGWLVLARSGRDRLAGLILSISLLKPQYCPFILVYLAWKRQWSQVRGFAIGGLIQAGLTLAIFLREGRLPVLNALLDASRFEQGGPTNLLEFHLSIRAAIWHLLPDAGSKVQLAVLVGATIVVGVVFLMIVGRRWDPQRPAFAWEVLALTGMVLVTSFHNHLLTLYLLLPPIAAILSKPPADAERQWPTAAVAVLFAVPSIGFVLSYPIKVYYAAGWTTLIGAIALGLFANREALRLPSKQRVPAIVHGATHVSK